MHEDCFPNPLLLCLGSSYSFLAARVGKGLLGGCRGVFPRGTAYMKRILCMVAVRKGRNDGRG
jgi:hypothetical protein